MAKIAILLCLAFVAVAVLARDDRQEITRGRSLNTVRRHDAANHEGMTGRLGAMFNGRRRPLHRFPGGSRGQREGVDAHYGGWNRRGGHGMHRMEQSMTRAAEVIGGRLPQHHNMMETLRAALMAHRAHRGQGHRCQGRGHGHGHGHGQGHGHVRCQRGRLVRFPDRDVNGRIPGRGSHHGSAGEGRVSVLSQAGSGRGPAYHHLSNDLRGHGRLGRGHRGMRIGHRGGARRGHGLGYGPRYGAL